MGEELKKKDAVTSPRRSAFEEKLRMFEMKKTPVRRKKSMEEKMTPQSLRKIKERSTSSTMKNRKYHAALAGVGERGKMLEGLRLGFATANKKKIGRSTSNIIKKLESCNGGQGLLVEVASPPQKDQVRLDNSVTNPFMKQAKPNLWVPVQDVRKDVIGARLGGQARPGVCDQPGEPYDAPGLARPEHVGYSSSMGFTVASESSM